MSEAESARDLFDRKRAPEIKKIIDERNTFSELSDVEIAELDRQHCSVPKTVRLDVGLYGRLHNLRAKYFKEQIANGLSVYENKKGEVLLVDESGAGDYPVVHDELLRTVLEEALNDWFKKNDIQEFSKTDKIKAKKLDGWKRIDPE